MNEQPNVKIDADGREFLPLYTLSFENTGVQSMDELTALLDEMRRLEEGGMTMHEAAAQLKVTVKDYEQKP